MCSIAPGLSTGTDYIYNRHYQQIAAVKASNGLSADGEFVGWGRLPYISAFDSAGKLVFNAEFPTGWNTYRAYLQRRDSGESQAQPRRHR